ncbi:MAG: membrane protein insertion efficiency factor YidD [Candidatus Neomarinimicrobiota bacterium]
MRYLSIAILLSHLFAQSKYPTDSLLISNDTPLYKKISLLPIAGWQRISYNTNLFNCQFYPSCSNYGAQAINSHGIIIGGIMTSDRIIRCNPFAYNYHLALNRPFKFHDERLIDPLEQQTIESKNSPLIAGLLSMIIPGLGRAYCGRPMDGMMGLWTLYLTSSSAYFAIKQERTILGPILGIASLYIYFGEIYGAWRMAKLYEKK